MLLGPFWVILEPFGVHFGRILEPFWGSFGKNLEAFCRQLRDSWDTAEYIFQGCEQRGQSQETAW